MPNQVGNSSWRPSAAWMTVAAVFVVVSLGSNFLAMRHSYFDSTPVGAMLLSDLIGRLLDDVVRLLLCLGGLLILWRGSGRSSFLLGMALIAMSPIPLDGTPMGPAARVAWRLGVEGAKCFVLQP